MYTYLLFLLGILPLLYHLKILDTMHIKTTLFSTPTMPDGRTFVIYAAFGDRDNMLPLYDALRSAGCKIDIYQTQVPGLARNPHYDHIRIPTETCYCPGAHSNDP